MRTSTLRRYRPLHVLAAAVLAAVLALGSAPPAAAQLPDVDDVLPVEVPGLGPIEGIEDLVELPGLDLADPILDTVTGVIGTILDLVDDVLAVTPLPNLLALQGEDAIDAAVAFSQATFDASDTAILARDDLFADALTTGALQGIFDAPLLLTSSGDLDARTARELVRLGVERLVIVGGEDAIDRLVRQKLEVAGIEVIRVGGPTRIETAADAAGEVAADATTAVLTRAYSSEGADDSQAYADLLAVSPWAAENGWPVLLSQSEVLTASVRDRLAQSDITEVVVIGGTAAISQAVEDELAAMDIDVRRVAGATRYGTAVAIAAERGYADSSEADRLILAEGGSSRPDVWAPGFAAAAHSARNGAPVILAEGRRIPAETMAFITDGMARNLLDGGPATICASFVDPIACQAVGLLLIGNITDAIDRLGIGLIDIPGLIDLLEELGLGDLATLLDALDGVVDGIFGGIADGDLQAVVDALLAAEGLDQIEGLVDGILGAAPGGGDGGGDLGDLIDDIVGGVVGGGGAGDGGILDPITDPITDPIDDIIGDDGLIPGLPGLGG